MDQGIYILTEDIADLIVLTQSESLYQKARDRLIADDWALLKLYRGKFQNPEIEKLLCQRIYQVADKDDEPRRSILPKQSEILDPRTLCQR